MKFSYYRTVHKIIILGVVAVSLTGCATSGSSLRLDSSLQRDVRTLGGVGYLPLVRLCDVYRLDCKWDSYARIATIRRDSNSVVLRAGSNFVLVNGEEKKLDRPTVLMAGAIFVPVSFVKTNPWLAAGKMAPDIAPLAEAPKIYTIKSIVIDPGHGGKDVGAIGRRLGLREKHMALSVAQRLREILQEAGIKVIMTRDDDTFISLRRRTEIANRSGADLFVSVHLNASRTRSVRGFECYYLSNAIDDNARALQALENSTLKLGEDARAERSRELDRTLWDMALTEARIESITLASHICESVEGSLTIGNKGIRSARFYVLKYTHMPAVLVEAGYISNRYEEMKLKEPKFLDRIADAVAQGILNFKREYERTDGYAKI